MNRAGTTLHRTMPFPSPTERQARILWFALTALAIGIVCALVGLMTLGAGWLINRLSGVLWPIALAGMLAYLLDPLVDFFGRLRVPRGRAILLVFMLAVMVVLIVLSTVLPKLIVETKQLVDQVPNYTLDIRDKVSQWLAQSHLGAKAKEAWESQYGGALQSWLTKALPTITTWLWNRVSQMASLGSLLVGLALVPVYCFYFLLEKKGIASRWKDYLPVTESPVKREIIFVLGAINDYLIVFFRGQFIVAMCIGILLTAGFLLLGLNYSFLLGMIAGLLSIIPYLGVALSLIPAVVLAFVQFGDWLHPLLVVVVFSLVQTAEGLFISPRIMGDRVGLHPLTIIIAVMTGTTLLGGILGGVLAIPLTAALRVIMFRYVWTKPANLPG